MSRAFTLIEISVVLGIIFIFIYAGSGLWTLAHEGSLRSQAHSQLTALSAHIYATHSTTGTFPAALPATLPTTDPWGNPYQYATGATAFTLSSFGPDGVKSTDDIVPCAP